MDDRDDYDDTEADYKAEVDAERLSELEADTELPDSVGHARVLIGRPVGSGIPKDETMRPHNPHLDGDRDGLGAIRGLINALIILTAAIALGTVGCEAATAYERAPLDIKCALLATAFAALGAAFWAHGYRNYEQARFSRVATVIFTLIAARVWLMVGGW